MQGKSIPYENGACHYQSLRLSEDLMRLICTESWTSAMLQTPSRTSSTEQKVQEWGGKLTHPSSVVTLANDMKV